MAPCFLDPKEVLVSYLLIQIFIWNYIIFIFYLTYYILCSLFSLLAHLLDCYPKFHFLRLSIKLLIMQSFLSHSVLFTFEFILTHTHLKWQMT